MADEDEEGRHQPLPEWLSSKDGSRPWESEQAAFELLKKVAMGFAVFLALVLVLRLIF